MKKIMFNDKYGLTDAVLEGRKTMTRRVINSPRRTIEGKEVCGFEIHMTHDGIPYDVWLTGPNDESICQLLPTYKRGEVVAIAQAYKDIIGDHVWLQSSETGVSLHRKVVEREAGWNNKLYVASEFMPHRIRITDIKVERLQDISDEDCIKEGLDWIFGTPGIFKKWTFFGTKKTWNTRREAFAALIDKVSGKGTWESNPWVFAYTFELID
jgi:hypothetical protein